MADTASKSEIKKVINKGNPGALNTQAQTFRGRKLDIYQPGLTKGMHGKAKGGHPTKRAQEMC